MPRIHSSHPRAAGVSSEILTSHRSRDPVDLSGPLKKVLKKFEIPRRSREELGWPPKKKTVFEILFLFPLRSGRVVRFSGDFRGVSHWKLEPRSGDAALKGIDVPKHCSGVNRR